MRRANPSLQHIASATEQTRLNVYRSSRSIYNWSVRWVPATSDVWPYMTLQFVCLPYSVPVCLSVRLSVRPSIRLFVRPSLCLWVSVCTVTEIVTWNSGFLRLISSVSKSIIQQAKIIDDKTHYIIVFYVLP